MKRLAFVGGCIALGAAAWGVGDALSSDALGMIIGLLFGVLVPLPGIFLILVAARRQQAQHDPYYTPHICEPPRPAALLPPPTIIVVQLPSGQRVQARVIDGQRRLDD